MSETCDECGCEAGDTTINFSMNTQCVSGSTWLDPSLVMHSQVLRMYCLDHGWKAGRRMFNELDLRPVIVDSGPALPKCCRCGDEDIDPELFRAFALESYDWADGRTLYSQLAAPVCEACAKALGRIVNPVDAIAAAVDNSSA